MSFADLLNERTPLQGSHYSHYGQMSADHVDRTITAPSDGLEIDGLETLRSLPDGIGHLSAVIPQDKVSEPMGIAAPIERAADPVKKEAVKVNWSLFGKLLACFIVPGLVYLAGVGIYNLYVACHNWMVNEGEAHQEDSIAPQRSGASASSQSRESVFESQEYSFRSPLSSSGRGRFQDNKEALEAEAQSLVRLKNQLQDEQRDLEELIPKVKEMSFITRKREGHPPSKELQARVAKIQEEIQGINRRARQIANELTTDCMQHPQFREISHSHEGFPFRIYFGASELRQGLVYGASEYMPRNDFRFQVDINKKLASWDGTDGINPFGTSRAALAQGVLVQLARRPQDPLTSLSWSERRLNPQTVDQTLKVRFQRNGTMLIERQVETRDGKRYQWNETVRFEEGSALITREVTEIRE